MKKLLLLLVVLVGMISCSDDYIVETRPYYQSAPYYYNYHYYYRGYYPRRLYYYNHRPSRPSVRPDRPTPPPSMPRHGNKPSVPSNNKGGRR